MSGVRYGPASPRSGLHYRRTSAVQPTVLLAEAPETLSISCEVMFQHGTLRINGTVSDMHNGFNGLAAKVQTALKDDPMSGHIF
nr:hypothetical protein LFOJIBMD_00076 [Klebsiella pneumoniae]UCK63449.1 hypothetical protein MMDIEEEF_00278 [Escherichia coli]UCK65021.1 hypothetical protein KCOLMDFC_00070 [Klebsiella pneumoniae]UPI14122.1 hypothetical protein ELJHPKHE_00011 [Klebsiella pneumoniae]USW59979.1 hypothetical protein KDGBBGBG_00012 [Klebsiella pneumoniae]